MPPKRRSAVAAVLPLAPEIPFSPGGVHTAEEYNARYELFDGTCFNSLGRRSWHHSQQLADLTYLTCFSNRKQQTTSWALNDLASSRDLAQWGNQLRSKARQWQQAFAVTAILLSIALAGLGYEVVTHHAGSPLLLLWSIASITTFGKHTVFKLNLALTLANLAMNRLFTACSSA